MRTILLVLAIALLGACEPMEPDPNAEAGDGDASSDDGGEPRSDGGATSDGAASMDEASAEDPDASSEDATRMEDPDASMTVDGDASPDMDATGLPEAALETDTGGNDAGAVVADGGNDAAPSCLVTRSAPDPTLLYAPGKVFTQRSTPQGGGLVDFSESLLAYVRGNAEQNQPSGWSLWRKDTGEMIDDSEFVPADSTRPTEINQPTESVAEAHAERFLAYVRNGLELVLRDARDGHEIWRAMGYAAAGPKKPPTAGLSRDGSYVWTAGGVANASSLLLEAFNATSTTPWLSATTDFAFKHAWAGANELVFLVGDSTGTTLRRFDRAGTELATIGPLAGGFWASFADDSHFITRSTGDLVRVYSRTGELKFQKTLRMSWEPGHVGGIGNVFWLDNLDASDLARLELYRLDSGATPFAAYGSATNVLTEGTSIAPGSSPLIAVDGTSAQPIDVPAGTDVAVLRGGQLMRVTSAGIVGPMLPRALGCGYTLATAADATRLYISSSAAGTLVYEAPFETPLGVLPPALSIATTRSSGHVALRTAENEVQVYDRGLQRVGTVTTNLSDYLALTTLSLSLSDDGSKLGISWRAPSSSPLVRSQVINVADGQVIHTIDKTYPTSMPAYPLAPRFSPSGARFAVSLRRHNSTYGHRYPQTTLYEGASELGLIEGQVTAWIDESSVVAYTIEAGSRLTAQGVRTGAIPCELANFFEPKVWLTPSRWYKVPVSVSDPPPEVCDLEANTATPDPAAAGIRTYTWLADFAIGRYGPEVAFLRPVTTSVRVR